MASRSSEPPPPERKPGFLQRQAQALSLTLGRGCRYPRLLPLCLGFSGPCPLSGNLSLGLVGAHLGFLCPVT